MHIAYDGLVWARAGRLLLMLVGAGGDVDVHMQIVEPSSQCATLWLDLWKQQKRGQKPWLIAVTLNIQRNRVRRAMMVILVQDTGRDR
jgi:hypothetical protein